MLRWARIVAWGAVLAVGTVFVLVRLGVVPSDRVSSAAITVGGPFELATHDGRRLSSKELEGRPFALFFGFTNCPDVCPTTLVEMAAILKQLGDQAERVQPIFITVDPERDTGKVLQTYTEFFDPRILGLTGSPALVRRAADNFRIRYAKVREPGAENYAVDHSAGMILLGPDGQFIRKFAFATPVDEITAQLAEIMGAYQASPARR